MPRMDAEMRKIFGPDIPSGTELDEMTALMLVNSHPSVDFPESLPPNIIQVGGLQIKEAKPVPKDIDEFFSKSKKGAVLMTLGTNIRSDELGMERVTMILEAFRRFPDYNFLWKFETSEMISSLPSNVKISDWLPQNDILAHPKLKLFISHAGLLSSHEATWWGKPIVGIPFYADQHRNAFALESAEVAVTVDVKSLSTENLRNAIEEVLGNPKYLRNMKIRSKRFRDQPEKPLARAVWWSEFVIRNPKPVHLKAAKFNFGLLGSHFWDIQVLIILAIVLIIVTVRRFIGAIFQPRSTITAAKKRN